jgi:N-acetylglucosamine-6-phosphate deacetylase
MPPVGTNQTEFALYDRTVYVDNGKLTSTTGELAGSSLDMASAVKNTHQGLGIALNEALRMGSLYPAEYLYQNQAVIRGELKQGMQADMVLLNDDLSVEATWISGKKV